VTEAITYFLVIVFLVTLALSAASTRYMAKIYQRSARPRSWFYRMMLNSSILKIVCGAYLGYSTGTFLLKPVVDLPRVPSDLNAPILLIIAIILIAPPIYYARTIFMVRRHGLVDPEVALAERTSISPGEVAATASPEQLRETATTLLQAADTLQAAASEDDATKSSGGATVNPEAPATEGDEGTGGSDSDQLRKGGSRETRIDKRADVQP
jgi:hypothetical protein